MSAAGVVLLCFLAWLVCALSVAILFGRMARAGRGDDRCAIASAPEPIGDCEICGATVHAARAECVFLKKQAD